MFHYWLKNWKTRFLKKCIKSSIRARHGSCKYYSRYPQVVFHLNPLSEKLENKLLCCSTCCGLIRILWDLRSGEHLSAYFSKKSYGMTSMCFDEITEWDSTELDGGVYRLAICVDRGGRLIDSEHINK